MSAFTTLVSGPRQPSSVPVRACTTILTKDANVDRCLETVCKVLGGHDGPEVAHAHILSGWVVGNGFNSRNTTRLHRLDM